MERLFQDLSLQCSLLSFDSYTHCYLATWYVAIPVNFDWSRMPPKLRNGWQHRFLLDFRGQTVTRIVEADKQRIVKVPYTHKLSHLWSVLADVATPDTLPIRLTMFNGGTFAFAYPAWPAVHSARMLDIVLGYPLFDNEIASSSEGIQFFVELDYQVAVTDLYSEMDLPTAQKLWSDALLIHQTLKQLFLCRDHTCVLLDCPPKMKKDQLIALGLHMVFTDIVVDSYTGAKLCQELQKRTRLVIDAAPYKSTSATLRPAFSRKVGKCAECQQHPLLMTDCPDCASTGKVGLGSFYIPRQVITHEGVFREYRGESTSIVPATPGAFSNPLL